MAMGRRLFLRALLALAVALPVGAVLPPSASASAVEYPVQAFGSRGTDVRAVQYLLRHRGYQLPPTGYFGPLTVEAVGEYQRMRGLPATGIVDSPTWRLLVTGVQYGDRSEAVKAVQLLLREKRGVPLEVDGVYGPATRSAMMAFEARHGLPTDGNAGAPDWRYLAWQFERPRFWHREVCPYGPGGARGHSGHWGTADTVAQVALAARVVHAAGLGAVAVGDISLEGGGPIRGHVTHRQGMDVDLRPMRVGRDQCSYPVTWYRWKDGARVCCHPQYDREATRTLIRAIRAVSGDRIQVIAFNDPQLIREGLSIHVAGHDDHLHVRYCGPRHADAVYRCSRG
jgi:peptidoglycan hydrolase-like protein with peptidoglycan-binding domain